MEVVEEFINVKAVKILHKKGGGWIAPFPVWVGDALGFNMDSREGKVWIVYECRIDNHDVVTIRRAKGEEVFKGIDLDSNTLDTMDWYAGNWTTTDAENYQDWLRNMQNARERPQLRPKLTPGLTKLEEAAYNKAPDRFTRKELLELGVSLGSSQRMIRKAIRWGLLKKVDEIMREDGGRPTHVFQKIQAGQKEKPVSVPADGGYMSPGLAEIMGSKNK